MRTHNPKHLSRNRQGFTLIEVLIVITIIGILVGLLIPAVGIAYRSIKKSAIAMEVMAIADAVEKYNQKYGDYPPDGSSRTAFERHCRKVFPQISSREILDVYATVANNQAPSLSAAAEFRVMDPPEALVFFLGGLSEDPVHPFTGSGGPLIIGARDGSGNPTVFQYNVDRNAPFFEFRQDQLTLVVTDAGITVSDDETTVMQIGPAANDAIPVYKASGQEAPFVYFAARTYSTTGGGGTYANHYSPPGMGFARPYKSENLNTSVTYGASTADRFYKYMNDKTFQVITAGLDDSFGGVSPLDAPAIFSVFPTGRQLNILVAPKDQNGALGYKTSDDPSEQLDNATNFSGGVLENSLP